MKKLTALVVTLVFAASAYAGMSMPGPDADELWAHITKTSLYKDWKNFPDHQGMQPGKAPHGPLHVVYANKAGMMKGHPKPTGTIVVKENFTADRKLAAVTVMYKVKGYNPEAGDWFWVKYTPEGKAEKAGKPRAVSAATAFVQIWIT